MTSWTIQPLEGVDDLLFSMTREEVAKVVGKPEKQMRMAPQSESDADVFTDEGIVVHYDTHGLMDAVEFSGPDTVQYSGKDLLSLSESDAKDWLEGQDDEAEIEPPDMTSKKLGIAFYAPMDKVESVLAFREDYFD